MNEYRTTDLSLASYLSTAGYHLKDIDKTNPKRSVFVFESDESLIKHVDGYWADTVKANPQKLFNSMKNLKTRLYS